MCEYSIVYAVILLLLTLYTYLLLRQKYFYRPTTLPFSSSTVTWLC